MAAEACRKSRTANARSTGRTPAGTPRWAGSWTGRAAGIMRRARGARRASGVAMPDLDPEELLSRAAGAQPVATGLLPAAWLSAVLLCAPPTPAAEDRADWRPAAGGPLHPLQPV